MIFDVIRLSAMAMMAFGVFLVFVSSYLLLKLRWLARAGVMTSGTIIELPESTVRDESGKHTFVRPTVRFVTSSGTVEFKSSSGEPAGRYSVGQSVGVRYLPQRPTIAEIDRSSRRRECCGSSSPVVF